MAVILLEIVGEAEGYDGQTGIVVGTSFVIFAKDDFTFAFVDVLAFLTVDVAHADVPAGCFEGLAQQSGVRKTVLHDISIPIKAQVDEVVVLSDDLSAWAREVQGV